MTSPIMTYSDAAVPSFFDKKTAAGHSGLSLQAYLGVFRSALAMASAVPTTGRVSAKQVERVRAMAEKL